ncbi:RNA polymerase-associated protein Rtf1 [Drosophila pseudoobscura]|uniref:RNA polymerase-associated protein Rtf1 n=1 Tax=Drosophila pseudoobscura pseudoobscura TaxID=46245 RepID=A0A6I8UFH9_DROPS|nr:RNA polymerase-associated protein Rtf1 [Drosophila pseudoobscura]
MNSKAKPSLRIEKSRRPISEIAQELRRLKASPLRIDDEKELPKPSVSDRPVKRLEQLEPVRLTRHRITQLLVRPAFEQAVTSCFVRVNVNGQGEQPEYRIAEIVGVEELGLGYFVDGIPTNITLRLRYNSVPMLHELNDISNMAFSLPEFQLWCDYCVNQGISPPTNSVIARKKIELYNALQSEAKALALIKQTCTLNMRPAHRGGILERHGATYPWRLQRPREATLSTPKPPSNQDVELNLESESD